MRCLTVKIEFVDSNLAKQEQLEELRKGIDARIAEVTKLSFENEQLHMKYQNFAEKYSPKNILASFFTGFFAIFLMF